MTIFRGYSRVLFLTFSIDRPSLRLGVSGCSLLFMYKLAPVIDHVYVIIIVIIFFLNTILIFTRFRMPMTTDQRSARTITVEIIKGFLIHCRRRWSAASETEVIWVADDGNACNGDGRVLWEERRSRRSSPLESLGHYAGQQQHRGTRCQMLL